MLNFSVTFVITIINIVILFFILRALLFKPLTKFMADRSQRIRVSLDQAEKDKTMAENLLTQYESRLKNAEIEAEEIIKTARVQATEEAALIISGSKAEAVQIIEEARSRTEAERLAAIALFKAEASALVVSTAGRLLRRELAGDEQQRYTVEALKLITDDLKNKD